MTMPWRWHEHPDADALAEACAARLVEATRAGLDERGRAVLALAGGSTAPPILARLARAPLAWRRVVAMPTDERWVDETHSDSNVAALRRSLESAAGIEVLALAPARVHGDADAGRAREMLARHVDPFDAVLLGLGADGHFASLFPGAANLDAALDPAGRDDAVAVVPDPMPASGPHARISLTLARLLRTRALVLAATGTAKRATIERAQRDANAAPVGALLHAPEACVEIHWSP